MSFDTVDSSRKHEVPLLLVVVSLPWSVCVRLICGFGSLGEVMGTDQKATDRQLCFRPGLSRKGIFTSIRGVFPIFIGGS